MAAQALPAAITAPAGTTVGPASAPTAISASLAPVLPPGLGPAQAAMAAAAPGMPPSFASLGQSSAPGRPGGHASTVVIAAPVAAGGALLLLAAITVVAACLLRSRNARQIAPETMRSSFAITPQARTPTLSADDSPGWQAVFSDAAVALPKLEMSIRRAPCMPAIYWPCVSCSPLHPMQRAPGLLAGSMW